LADWGNLKFPDLNCIDFGGKNPKFYRFWLKKQVLAIFYVLFVRKTFFNPNLRGGVSGKPSSPSPPLANIFGENMKKIWKN
jgi:hypothetical protein